MKNLGTLGANLEKPATNTRGSSKPVDQIPTVDQTFPVCVYLIWVYLGTFISGLCCPLVGNPLPLRASLRKASLVPEAHCAISIHIHTSQLYSTNLRSTF